jgi:hypothetical protein
VRGILNIPIPEVGVRYHFTPRFRALASYTYHNLSTNFSLLGTHIEENSQYHIAKIGAEYTFSPKPFHAFAHLDWFYAGGSFYNATRSITPASNPDNRDFDVKQGTINGMGLGAGIGLEYAIQNRVFIGIMPYVSFLSTATRSYQHNGLRTESNTNIKTETNQYVSNEQSSFFFFYPVTLSVGCRL